MQKDAQLVNNLQCLNADYTYEKLLEKDYGVTCFKKENAYELEFRYIENLLYIDLLKSGESCPKTICNK